MNRIPIVKAVTNDDDHRRVAQLMPDQWGDGSHNHAARGNVD